MSTRTTVTLEDDVLERVRDESRRRGKSFRETLNELLRTALVAPNLAAQRRHFKIKPSPVGLRPGLSYDNIEALIEYGEGPYHT
jgi:hypothetical protein